MTQYIDNLVAENTLTENALVVVPSSTVTASGTLALTVASAMDQRFTGSTTGQIVKLPDATTLALGQRYELFNAASVSVAVQDGAAAALLTLQPNQLAIFRNAGIGTAGGVWYYTALDQSMAANDQLYCTYPGTGLLVNYLAGIVYFGGTEYVIAAGSTTVSASITGGFIYVDPTSHAVASGATLPNNAVAMATFTSGVANISALNDARDSLDQNLVWGVTGDLVAQTSQSTASGGSLEKYARADHKHAMNINLMKSGVVASGTFAGTPKTAAVTFATAFADTAYEVKITGVDVRSWSYSSKLATGFTIQTNANQALTGEVSWTATKTGEAA